jgi:hypothetical protein
MTDRRIDRLVDGDQKPPLTSSDPPISAGTTGRAALAQNCSGRQRVGKRDLRRLRGELSDRDWAILRFIAEFRFVSTSHLRVVQFDGLHPTPAAAARSCGRVLARLSRLRLLIKLDRRIGGLRAGSENYVYALGPIGIRLLDRRSRQGGWAPSTTLLQHSLAVTDVFTSLVTAGQSDLLQVISYETEPRCWRSLPGYGTSDTMRPDLLVVIGHGEDELHWWIEVDRGSEHRLTVKHRLELYLHYFESGQEQRQRGVFPRVCWLTTTAKRAKQLQALAEQVQGDLPLFSVGLIENAVTALLDRGGKR